MNWALVTPAAGSSFGEPSFTRLSVLRLVVIAMVEVPIAYFKWRVAWVLPQLHHVCRREVGSYLSMGDCPRTLGGSQPSSRRARNEGLEGDVDRAVPTGARSS